MRTQRINVLSIGVFFFLYACQSSRSNNTVHGHIDGHANSVKAAVATDPVLTDSDDPAIWINAVDRDGSLIIGTDKGDTNGGLYVFTLDGKLDHSRTVTGLKRPNNVDVAYGIKMGDRRVDIAAATERDRNRIRIFSLPDMKAIDQGGIEVFTGESERRPMGIALYTRPSDSTIFAIISRKNGPREGYLEQYRLVGDSQGSVTGILVRRFGKFSGKKEIESIAVDNELGYVYYSDEQTGIRKYYADPEKGDSELALLGQGDFREDNEGISIYKLTDSTGYILVSDQSANRFNVYPREQLQDADGGQPKIASIPVSAHESDGSDVTVVALPGFPHGLFVAMSNNKTFELYSWDSLAKYGNLQVRTESQVESK